MKTVHRETRQTHGCDDRTQRLDRDRLDMKVNKHKRTRNREPYLKKMQIPHSATTTKNTSFKATNKCRTTTHKLIINIMTEYIPLYFFISFQFVFQGYKIVSVSLIFVPKI